MQKRSVKSAVAIRKTVVPSKNPGGIMPSKQTAQAEREPSKLTVYVDANVIKEAKKLAIDENTSLSQMIEDLLKSRLHRPSRAATA